MNSTSSPEATITTTHTSRQARAEEAEEALAKKTRELEEAEVRAEGQQARDAAALASQQQQNAALQQDLEDKEGELGAARQAQALASGTIKALEAARDDAMAAHRICEEALAAAQAALKGAESGKEELEGRVEALEQQGAALQAQHLECQEALAAEKGTSEGLQIEVTRLSSRLNDAELARAAFQEEADKLKQGAEEAARARDTLARVEGLARRLDASSLRQRISHLALPEAMQALTEQPQGAVAEQWMGHLEVAVLALLESCALLAEEQACKTPAPSAGSATGEAAAAAAAAEAAAPLRTPPEPEAGESNDEEVPFLGTFLGAERVDDTCHVRVDDTAGVTLSRAAAPPPTGCSDGGVGAAGREGGGAADSGSEVEVELELEYRISRIESAPGGRAAFESTLACDVAAAVGGSPDKVHVLGLRRQVTATGSEGSSVRLLLQHGVCASGLTPRFAAADLVRQVTDGSSPLSKGTLTCKATGFRLVPPPAPACAQGAAERVASSDASSEGEFDDESLMLAAALADLREAVAADGGQLGVSEEAAESDTSEESSDALAKVGVRSVVSEVSLDPSLWVGWSEQSLKRINRNPKPQRSDSA